jgi:two-component system CheB/CheR fusion protein
MPSNAIATGFVDLILPAEEIPAKLLEYVRSFDELAPVLANDPPIQARDKTVVRPQEAISAILLEQLRHDFSAYKDKTFLRRVQRRMQVLQLNEVEAYVALLRQDNGEAKLLFRDLLINVTGFFRDFESFVALEQQIIPKLFEGKGAGDSVRIWIPGCATGTEQAPPWARLAPGPVRSSSRR